MRSHPIPDRVEVLGGVGGRAYSHGGQRQERAFASRSFRDIAGCILATRPGDLDRLEKIIDLVDFISGMDIQDIFNNTIDSASHNRECIISGQFANNCNLVNQKTEKSIIDKFVC
jgi:hypothetical protein